MSFSKNCKKMIAILSVMALAVTCINWGYETSTVKGEEEETETVAAETVVAFDYDGTDCTVGTDLDYAYEEDGYEYTATYGTGTMCGSVNGTDLKHIEWGDSADYGVMIPILAASSKNLWSADAYVSYSFSTEGYTSMSATVQVAGTKKGPANLLIGYYDDSNVFQTITSYSISKNKTIYTVSITLPQVLENCDSVTVYIKLADTTNIGGNEMTDEAYSSGGELAFNAFTVSGYAMEEETTTVAETTVAEESTSMETTAAAETASSESVEAPGKAVISKISAKKISAKKLKIKIKSVSGADGYQVYVLKNKKTKKALYKKNVTRLNITLKSVKLKNKKKLFVKVRAYVLDSNNNKVYGKWSKVKKVKIK